MRFLKYYPGGYFATHFDGQYRRPDGSERSFITIQIYINEGFEGGETTFYKGNTYTYARHINDPDGSPNPIVPKIGRVLVFQHDILHEGTLLISGIKYTIRTDVMYKPM
jgi:hypothetical protein